MNAPSYHDLHITTNTLARRSIFDLPYHMRVTCTRTGGWELWQSDELVAGEYADNGLKLDVDGVVIVDSLGVALDGQAAAIRAEAAKEAK